MSTRGIVILKKDNEEYGFFNHWDSYASGLGKDLQKFFREKKIDLDTLKSVFDCLKPARTKEPGDMFLPRFEGYLKPVKLKNILDDGSKIPFENDIKFKDDTCFCEWQYVFDLDDNKVSFIHGATEVFKHSFEWFITKKINFDRLDKK